MLPLHETSAVAPAARVSVRPSRNQCSTGTSFFAIATIARQPRLGREQVVVRAVERGRAGLVADREQLRLSSYRNVKSICMHVGRRAIGQDLEAGEDIAAALDRPATVRHVSDRRQDAIRSAGRGHGRGPRAARPAPARGPAAIRSTRPPAPSRRSARVRRRGRPTLAERGPTSQHARRRLRAAGLSAVAAPERRLRCQQRAEASALLARGVPEPPRAARSSERPPGPRVEDRLVGDAEAGLAQRDEVAREVAAVHGRDVRPAPAPRGPAGRTSCRSGRGSAASARAPERPLEPLGHVLRA